jgi:DNA-binding NtrC family response regulator
MDDPMPHALLVEDDVASLETLDRLVQRHGFTTSPVQTVEQALKEIESHMPEFAVLDLDLPDGNGLDLLDHLHYDTEVLVLTGHGTIDSAVSALHSGVSDYLTKPFDPGRFQRVISNVKRTLDLRKEVTRLRDDLRRMGRFDQLVGSSKAMQEIYDLITRVSPTSSTVLLTGETGVGKDMVAQTIHRLSRRAEKPFVPVNCGAIQPTLIESELFGHEAGSFTGASRTRKGIFEQAQGGTLFLDEITEMQIDMQVKLLRVLETRQIKRVGGEKPIDVDVRLIAATNRSPESAVKDGKLREDLFYRLRVFPIRVPGLRERERDIELLATYFLTELNGDYEQPKRFLPAALDRMQSYDWPGNVRELRNVVERAAILAGERIGPEHVQIEGSADRRRSGSEIAVEVGSTIAEAEKQLILATLERLNENKKEAAATLGISLKTLYNRLNVYGIGRSDNS